jgi:hypothetical protein
MEKSPCYSWENQLLMAMFNCYVNLLEVYIAGKIIERIGEFSGRPSGHF